MKSLWLCGIFFLFLSQAHAINRMVEGFPELPPDARYVAETAQSCIYFSGEYGGDNSERDRQISQKLRKLGCDTIKERLDKMATKYQDNEHVMQILKQEIMVYFED